MNDERLIDLVQSDLDGELAPAERAGLARLLLANAEARACRDELRAVCAALDGIEEIEPPAQLRETVLRSLVPRTAPRDRLAPARPATSRPWVGYAAAFAAGLLITATAFELSVESRDGLGVAELVGTMATPGTTAGGRRGAVQVDREEVRGRIEVERTAAEMTLRFDLALQQPMDVHVSYGEREFTFKGLPSSGTGARERFVVVLVPSPAGGDSIGVQFFASGRLVHEEHLAAPVGN